MSYKSIVFYCLFLFTTTALFAQTETYGVWSSIGLEKRLGKWNFAIESELRISNYSWQIDRWSLKFESSYNIFKSLQVGTNYEFINFYDTKYFDYQPRHRVGLFIQGKYKLGRFTFSLVEKAQVTQKDESDRIKKSGEINAYAINPAWIWRSRLKLSYNIPKFPITPALSVESFYQLNNPEGNKLTKLRYKLSFNYNINKHNQFEIYGLFDKEMNVSAPVKSFVAGIGYVHAF